MVCGRNAEGPGFGGSSGSAYSETPDEASLHATNQRHPMCRCVRVKVKLQHLLPPS